MQPMQHLFAWTNPLPELAGATREAEHAILRHQDRDAYYRQRGEQYGIGSYAHDPLPIDVPELNRGKEGHQIAQGDFTPEHFTDTWDATRMLVPPVYAAGVAESFNGHFAFTPDSYPCSARARTPAGCSSPRASGSRTQAARDGPSAT